MRCSQKKRGLTLAEVVGVLAMLAVLGAAITPHLRQARDAARLSKLKFNLQKLRKRIDDYRQRTNDVPPADLQGLYTEDDSEVPDNPFSTLDQGLRNRIKIVDRDPPTIHDVTHGDRGGWLYNPGTGGVWADHQQYLDQ